MNTPLIVLDTGVVVRALTGRADSSSSEVVRAARTGEVRLAVSDSFLAEMTRVLREPRVEARVGSAGRAFEVALDLGFMGHHCRVRMHDWPSAPDPNDYWMLDLALASGADFIVTWDPYLLDREIPLPVEVVTPDRFLEGLDADSREHIEVPIRGAPYCNQADTGRYTVDRLMSGISQNTCK